MEDFSPQQIQTLKTIVTQIVKDEFRETRDLLMREIKASEQRVKGALRQEMQQAKQEVIESVAEILDTRVLPRIDNHKQRLTKLETKLI